MNKLKPIIALLVLTFFSFGVFAQTDSKDVSITSSGSGKTLEDAKQAALRSATEQAFGAFISSKTEMFNDQVVADQMSSVSSGNIKSYEVLNQDQLPDGRWGVTIKTIVSVDKLTSFVQAKGIEVEFKGSFFAVNIKQQQLNEEGEIKVINQMVELLHLHMQKSFDYTIESGQPQSIDNSNEFWNIPLTITSKANKNFEFCANYFIETLASISLKKNEVETYNSVSKKVFSINTLFKETENIFYLRKEESIDILNNFAQHLYFYPSLFTISNGVDEISSRKINKSNVIMPSLNKMFETKFYHNFYEKYDNKFMFIKSNDVAAIFSYNDKKSLTQINQIKGYKINAFSFVFEKLLFGGEIFTVCEQMPEFPGGAMEMMKYIQSQIKYPPNAQTEGLSGTCFLKFVVTSEGSITDVQVLKGLPRCSECDLEAIRVVENMPNWKPGRQNGQVIYVYFNLPINFRLR